MALKKMMSLWMVLAVLVVSAFASVTPASAEELKLVGTISRIELATDGKSATVIVKDNKSEASIPITIIDDLTLDKFKDKRIVEGDEIRTKYETDGGKNTSKMFKKTAGC